MGSPLICFEVETRSILALHNQQNKLTNCLYFPRSRLHVRSTRFSPRAHGAHARSREFSLPSPVHPSLCDFFSSTPFPFLLFTAGPTHLPSPAHAYRGNRRLKGKKLSRFSSLSQGVRARTEATERRGGVTSDACAHSEKLVLFICLPSSCTRGESISRANNDADGRG